MSSENDQGRTGGSHSGTVRVDLYRILPVLVRWRRLIAWSFVIVTAFSVGVSFVLPKWYKATASIMPPKEQDMLGSLGTASALLRGLPGVSRSVGMSQQLGAYNYLAVLKSRTAMEMVVRKFDLIHVYDVDDESTERAIKALRDNVEFTIQDEDYITVDVFDRDPHRAAQMADYFVEVLNQISLGLSTQEAHDNRAFIEKRVNQTQRELASAEDTLKMYLEKNDLMISPDQASASLGGVAELYALKTRREVELGVLEKTVSPDNPTVKSLQLELGEIDRKIALIPASAIGVYRLYREVLIRQKMLEVLIPMLEQSKVEEQRTVPVILVLDHARVPEQYDHPKKRVVIGVGAVAGLLFSFLYIVSRNRLLQLKALMVREWKHRLL